MFGGWAKGYYAASIGIDGKEACRQYIINQEEHHKRYSYLEEMESAVRSAELEWREDDWE